MSFAQQGSDGLSGLGEVTSIPAAYQPWVLEGNGPLVLDQLLGESASTMDGDWQDEQQDGCMAGRGFWYKLAGVHMLNLHSGMKMRMGISPEFLLEKSSFMITCASLVSVLAFHCLVVDPAGLAEAL